MACTFTVNQLLHQPYLYLSSIKQNEAKMTRPNRAVCCTLIFKEESGVVLTDERDEQGVRFVDISYSIYYLYWLILYYLSSCMQAEANNCPGCFQYISQERIRKHIETCPKYPSSILRQVQKFDSKAPPNLIKFLLKQLQISSDKLNSLMHHNHSSHKEQRPLSEILGEFNSKNGNKPSPMRTQIMEEPNRNSGVDLYETKVVKCAQCDRKYYQNFDRQILFYVYDCWHVFCMPCINKYIDTQFVDKGGNLKCLHPGCSTIMMEDQLKGLLGNQKFQTLQNKAIRKMCNLIECCKCKSEFEFQEGNAKDAPKKDPTGKDIKPEYARDYAVNRFVCPTPACKTEQCKSCQTTPYHLGMTCKQSKDRALSKKCRYCDEPITEKNAWLNAPKALADICRGKQCQELAKGACDKILGCGHPCYGSKGEKTCLPCLNQKCAEGNAELNGVNGDQYCAVCYVQALSASPCIRSACGHIFHVKCLKKRFQIKWLTPRIFFNFCLCPLCKKWIKVPPESQLCKYSNQNETLYQKVQGMALERLKFQQLEKSDPKLKDKASPYFGKPKEYAMVIYAYFMCFKCKKPYFGGRKDCVAAMNEANAGGGSFKPQELICPGCCDIPVQNCPKHGKDFIEFKCKFCCSIAQWFCWGNTHFCDPCHKKQCSGDYVSKYTKEQLPKCKGAGACPIGGNHNGNGQEKMLGCAICRNIKDNHRNF